MKSRLKVNIRRDKKCLSILINDRLVFIYTIFTSRAYHTKVHYHYTALDVFEGGLEIYIKNKFLYREYKNEE